MRVALAAGFIGALLLGVMLAPPAAHAADLPVDLELVLAVDASRSMDASEQRVQRDGYINAIRHPDVVAAIASGPDRAASPSPISNGPGPSSQQVVVPWTLIDGAASRRGLRATDRARAGHRPLRDLDLVEPAFSARLFDDNGFAGRPPRHRRVRRRSEQYRAAGRAGARPRPRQGDHHQWPADHACRAPSTPTAIGDLDAYYRDCVVGGAGAFTLAVTAADQFEGAIRRKLIQEIAAATPRIVPAPPGEDELAIEPSGADCLIGEKRRGRTPASLRTGDSGRSQPALQHSSHALASTRQTLYARAFASAGG